MKYGVFDVNGFPTGFYADDIHGPRFLPLYGEVVTRPIYGPVPEPTESDPNLIAPIIGNEPDPSITPNPPVVGHEANPDTLIPSNAIQITDAQWQEFLSNQGTRRWDYQTGEVVVYRPPPSPPAPYTLQMSDFWSRFEDDAEYEAFDAAVSVAPLAKDRRAFGVAVFLVSSNPLFAWTKSILVNVVGAERADVIMAPSVAARPSAEAEAA